MTKHVSHLHPFVMVNKHLNLSHSCCADGHPIMASGSPIGHIGLWDLEEKKLVSQLRDAHTTAIAGLTFLQSEPLLITNGADNAIRVCGTISFFLFLRYYVDSVVFVTDYIQYLDVTIRPQQQCL